MLLQNIIISGSLWGINMDNEKTFIEINEQEVVQQIVLNNVPQVIKQRVYFGVCHYCQCSLLQGTNSLGEAVELMQQLLSSKTSLGFCPSCGRKIEIQPLMEMKIKEQKEESEGEQKQQEKAQ